MKKLFAVLVVLLSLSGCTDHEKEFYFNRSGVIVGMSLENGVADFGKFGTEPRAMKIILIQDEQDKEMHVEVICYPGADTYHSDCLPFLTKEWFYNHKVGDAVFFKYIRKDRYFKIHNN